MARKKPTTKLSPKIKRHIAPNYWNPSSVLVKRAKIDFGIDIEDLSSICLGDEKKAEEVGELARQGALLAANAEVVAERYRNIIEGTTAYNRAVADVLIESIKGSLELRRANDKVKQARLGYDNQIKEINQENVDYRRLEKQRHSNRMDYLQFKGYLDRFIRSVESDANMYSLSVLPEKKQRDADIQEKKMIIDEGLQHGSQARYDFIPKKDFSGAKLAVLKIRAALGI